MIPHIAGLKYWGKMMYFQLMSYGNTTDCNGLPLVSVSDEALAFFMWENYYKVWRDSFLENECSFRRRQDGSEALYSNPRCGNTRYGGWSDQGLDRFNDIFDKCAAQRRNPDILVFERSLFERLQDTIEGAEAVEKRELARATRRKKAKVVSEIGARIG